ncbi:class F sortase [Amycolatopsis anabasis]|uniref:class F sortase n=1 Tax=Amycolatopsis anabasis TaxID=1840409 RepID=UPI00131A85BB|nr:class F sortase [Amycolatopsis anabasis]
MEEVTTPPAEHTGTAGGLSLWRRWTAGVLGALAVAALVAGVYVLGLDQRPRPAPVAVAAPPPGAPVQLPGDASGAVPLQEPGTVRMPEGGTARLVREEVTAEGTLPIPHGLDEAAWWGAKLGAERGAALLSGHVNWAGVRGPFDELWRIRPGQTVRVVDTAGGHWVYRVTDIVTVHKDDLPAQAPRLFGQEGSPRLVLVTCGGDYLGGTDGYRDNRVVIGTLIARP